MVKIIRFCDTCDYCNEETGACENKKSRHFGGFMLSETACELYENDYQTEEEETLPAVREETALIQETGKNIRELLAGMRAMGEMMRVMNERMTAMERTIRTLEKVTPGQVTRINKLIRQRAGDVCEEYRIPGEEKAVAAMIRTALRTATGAQAMREISRCDMEAVEDLIVGWDDYERIMRLIRMRKELGK